jgi:predicted  nucleic acid-binding Zn-ribbon protein
MTTEYEGSETIPSESYLEPTRYKVNWRCVACGHEWSRTLKVIPKKDPPCPSRKCVEVQTMNALKEQNAKLTAMLAEQRGPAQIGANNVVRAIDTTADIVMTDYNMTNLKDNVRAGESVAPKLDDPKKQQLADNYFAPTGGMPVISAPGERKITMPARQMSSLGRRAIAGAFRGMAVAPTAVTPNAAKGQSPLTRVRTEIIGGGGRR